MSVALKEPMSLEAFLDWESRQEFKYEFDGFQPVAMVGVTDAHTLPSSATCWGFCSTVSAVIAVKPWQRPEDPGGRTHSLSGCFHRLLTRSSRGATVVHDPVVVFEILSPGTSYKDRIEKNREYRATPSIQRYVILEQSRPAATVYARAGSDRVADFLISDADLGMPEIGIGIPLNELYEGVAFPPETSAAESG